MAVSRRLWLGWAVTAAFLWACAGLASAAGLPGTGTRRSSRGDRKPLKYYVLQVLGVTGDVTFEVCGDIEYAKRQKDYKEEYNKAGEEWMKDKRDAQKRKEEFKTPPPKGPKLIQKMEGSFKKEEDARAAAEKLQKQWTEAMEKRQAKKAEEATKAEEPKKEQ